MAPLPCEFWVRLAVASLLYRRNPPNRYYSDSAVRILVALCRRSPSFINSFQTVHDPRDISVQSHTPRVWILTEGLLFHG